MHMQAKDLFVSQDEQEVATLTAGSIGLGGTLKKEHCVISDKRLYHNGVAYVRGGGAIGRATRRDTIELADIHGTSIGTMGNVKLLLFFFLIIPLIMYFCTRIRYMEIHTPGGSIVMEYKWCKMQTLRAFDKKIHLAADAARKVRHAEITAVN